MKLFDCTLRDGANVIGKGFDAELTKLMLDGMIANGIEIIEFGNCLGIGAYEENKSIAPLNDDEYLELIQPYLGKAQIGMFIGYKNTHPCYIEKAARGGLDFLRVGCNAGDGALTEAGIKAIKGAGLKCFYSMMKGYILSADDLAEEAAMLESFGLDEITIMDSAGTMFPEQVREYVSKMVAKVNIPVGFHGHNNLGLSCANAMAAYEAGASRIDGGLLGMARSTGNLPIELAVAAFRRRGVETGVDFFGLLGFLDKQLVPAMEKQGYHTAIKPVDLICGYSGCHSSFLSTFESVARNENVDLFRLITDVSEITQKLPNKAMMETVAKKLK